MQASYEATLLRIFIPSNSQRLHDQIVLKAREMKLAGATVMRGIMGYGPALEQRPAPRGLVEESPIIVEIVDTDEKIREFLPIVDGMIDSGLIFTQKVRVARLGHVAKNE